MTDEKPVPLWRQILRGFSQCAFQANEISGILFVLAVFLFNWKKEEPFVFNWRMTVFFVIAVVLGTLTARLLRGIGVLLDLGLYGFNSGLVGLALANFFEPNPMFWLWVPVFAVMAAVLTVIMSKWVPIPFLAAPFILTFWLVWLLSGTLGLVKIDFGASPPMEVHLIESVIKALGSALFVGSIASGIIFLFGIAISNWRHAIVAVIGAIVANALAAHVSAPAAAINSGFIGFNAVLAALAAYAIIAADLRLVVLASFLATWLASFVFREYQEVPVLASGFVLAVWAMLILGWLNPRLAEKPAAAKTEPA